MLTKQSYSVRVSSLKGQEGRGAVTIIANVKVQDGIVLATDSMSQIVNRNEAGEIQFVKAYSNAKKLFQVRKLPMGIMSYGLGSIGVRSIENLVLEFSRDLGKYAKEPYTVEVVCRALHTFIKDIYDTAFHEIPIKQKRQHLRLGFFISGYSPKKFLAHTWEFELPDAKDIREVRAEDKFGSSWRGVPIPFGRLYNGFDPRIAKALRDAGVADEIVKQILTVEKWRLPINYTGMPVQDAVNFAVYILETTIGAATFELGVPSCGGPLQVAVVRPGEEWEWVQEPQLAI